MMTHAPHCARRRDRSLRWVERPVRVIGHRHRAMSRKTLPTMVGTFPFVIPISWRQLLRNFEVPSPVGNVFPSNVFPVDETDSQPAIGASTLRVSTGHACLLGASLIVATPSLIS